MDVELLTRNAISKIKDTWGLPKTGFITGGSLANIIWEEVSGNKAVVNDVDVFILDSFEEKFVEDKNKFLYSYGKDEDIWYDDYSGINFMSKNKHYYSITESTNDGIFNYVKYKSNSYDPMIVIESFDINSVCVGYSVDSDKVFYTKEFEDFLSTGELKVTNLKTPCHTAIRIIKKSKELNALLDDNEFRLIQHAISKSSQLKPYKVRFQERYLELFKNHIDKLSEFFYIEKDVLCMQNLKHSGIDVSLWRLLSNKEVIFSDKNIGVITNSDEYLFYMRNIYDKDDMKKIWEKIHYLYDTIDYIDELPSTEDLELLSRIISVIPKSINNLRGLKISEQINLIKNLIAAFDDKLIVLKILDNKKLNKDIVLDETTKLILELSVRREIINDDKDIVNRVFKSKSEPGSIIDDMFAW